MEQAAAGPTDTFPKLLIRNAYLHGSRPSMRHKDFGIWQTWTWSQLLDEVRAFAVGLQPARAASAATRSPSSATTGRASMVVRRPCRCSAAIPVPVYPDSVADEMAYVLAHAEVQLRRRSRTRSRSTRSSRSRSGCRSSSSIIYDEERGLARLRPRPPAFLRRRASRTAAKALRQPGARRLWLERDRRGKGSDVASCSTPRAPPASPRA